MPILFHKLQSVHNENAFWSSAFIISIFCKSESIQ